MIKPIELRRSVRKYLDKPIADEIILKLLESARIAPSANNSQPWHFIVIKDRAIREKIVKAANNQKWMLTAPIIIACVADIRARLETVAMPIDEESPQREVKEIIRDTSIAIEHLVLEATNEGLGTCWIAWFKQNEIRPILSIPNDKYLVSLITVGYPNDEPKARNRKEIKEIIHYDKW
jgi:nitroreductase